MSKSPQNQETSPSTTPIGLRSQVYTYFTLSSKDSKEAVCRQCNKVVPRGGKNEGSFNTTNLWAHVKKCSGRSNDEDTKEQTESHDVLGARQEEAQPSSPQLSLSQQRSETHFSQAPSQSAFSQRKEGIIGDNLPLASSQSISEQRNGSASPPPKKVTVTTSTKKSITKWPADSPKSIEITNAIAQMIAMDFQPLSLVENEGFRNLLEVLAPNYTIPSRKTFTKRKIPDMFQHGLGFLKSQVRLEMNMGSITTDLWSSVTGDSYISLTLHYITQSFEKRELTLGVSPFDKSHDGDNIAEAILSTLASWGIGIEKILCGVHDNASNVCLGVRLSGCLSIRCANHTLQLVIFTDSIDHNKEITGLITNVKAIVAHFHRSDVSRSLLYQAQIDKGLKKKKLLQDSDTRWNASYYMLKRFSEQSAAIRAALPKTKCNVELRKEEWDLIERVIQVLEPFEQVTKAFERESASISEVIPLIVTLRNGVAEELDRINDPSIDKLLEYLKKSLDERFLATLIDSQNPTTHMIATILDARFKMEAISGYIEVGRIKEKFIELMSQEFDPFEEEHKTLETDRNAPQKKALVKQGIWGRYVEMKSPNLAKKVEGGYSFQMELDVYLREPCLAITADPLSFWKREFQSYPRLAKLARKYLSAPPGSCTSERVFSTAGNIVTNKRSNLNPDVVNTLVFLNRNCHYLIKSWCFLKP